MGEFLGYIIGIFGLIYVGFKLLQTLFLWLIILINSLLWGFLIVINSLWWGLLIAGNTLLAFAIFIAIPVCAIWLFIINFQRMKDANYKNTTIIPMLILTIGLGVSTGFWYNLKVWQQFLSILGIAVKLEVSKPFLLVFILGSGIMLAVMMIYPPLKQARRRLEYRRK